MSRKTSSVNSSQVRILRKCRACSNDARPGKIFCTNCSRRIASRLRQRKAQGLCRQCSNPAVEGRGRCAKHLTEGRVFSKDKKFSAVEQKRVLKALLGFDGKCQICGSKESPKKKHDIDHDHKTKRFRGVVCRGCNLFLSWVEKNEGRILETLSYLYKTTVVSKQAVAA